jgi:transposase
MYPSVSPQSEAGENEVNSLAHNAEENSSGSIDSRRVHELAGGLALLSGHRPVRVQGRELLDRLEIPDPWRQTVDASLDLIDYLERQIAEINRDLKASGAEHPYVPLLLTVPGIGWVLAFTIAAEIGEITRFASAKKLCGYTGLCPRVHQSGESDRRGPLTKQGPKYLRWAMLETTMHALRHPAYSERYQRNKKRLGRQRGVRVAQIDIARKLTEAIWHLLTNNQPFAPTPASGGAASRLVA